MIVIKTKRLVYSLVLLFLISAGLVVLGLRLHAPQQALNLLDYQTFLFWGLVALFLQIWISAALFFSHIKIIRNVKRLSKIQNIDSEYAEKLFSETGTLGEEMKKLMRHGSELSGLRAARISALNNLAVLISDGYDGPLIITDVKGEFFAASSAMKNRLKKEINRDSIDNITDIISDLKISEILLHMEAQRAEWKNEKGSIYCTPVFDKNQMIQFCVWEFEQSILSDKLKEQAQKQNGNKKSINRTAKNFISNLRRRK